MHTCIHMYMEHRCSTQACTYAYICIHMYMERRCSTQAYTYMYTCTHAYTHICTEHRCHWSCARRCSTQAYTYIHTCIHMYMEHRCSTQAYTYTYTHAYTCTQSAATLRRPLLYADAHMYIFILGAVGGDQSRGSSPTHLHYIRTWARTLRTCATQARAA